MRFVRSRLILATLAATAMSFAWSATLAAPPGGAAVSGGLPATRQIAEDDEVTMSEAEVSRAQIAAAVSSAFVNLRRDVENSWIGPDLVVRDFLESTKGQGPLMSALRDAEQIGGPRWVDDQTCQVKLEIGGERVARTLVDIATSAATTSPMPPEEVDRRLAGWKRRTFIATGSSIRADKVQNVRPIGEQAWRGVSDAARQAAVEAARDNAVARVMESMRPIPLDQRTTAGELLGDEKVSRRVVSWLRRRPVTNLQFQDSLQVSYTLSVNGDELFSQLLEAADRAGVKVPVNDAALSAAREQFANRIGAASTGVASAKREARDAAAEQLEAIVPPQPPGWIFQAIDASGTAQNRASPLRAKQEAEDRATDAIRDKLLAQPLSEGLTVGEASKRSGLVRQAISRAMSRVRLYNVDHGAEGEVTVKMTLDPREFWFDLTRR